METSRGREQNPGPYFLDTSTQINRHWSDEETNNKVRADLLGKKLRCSIYVEREYRCKVLNTLITAHNVLIKSEDIRTAKERTEKLKRNGIFDYLVYNTIKRLFKRFNSKKPIIRRLKNLIEGAWENFFYDAVPKALCDMTNCTRGSDAPQLLDHGYYLEVSRKCPQNCKICEFWQSKQNDLQNLAEIDTSKFTKTNDPKGTMNKIQAEAQAILGGKSAHGDPCRNLSDAVISIEARGSYPGITIHAMDYDFELLKNILNTQVRFLRV